jgi:hypothetical protein
MLSRDRWRLGSAAFWVRVGEARGLGVCRESGERRAAKKGAAGGWTRGGGGVRAARRNGFGGPVEPRGSPAALGGFHVERERARGAKGIRRGHGRACNPARARPSAARAAEAGGEGVGAWRVPRRRRAGAGSCSRCWGALGTETFHVERVRLWFVRTLAAGWGERADDRTGARGEGIACGVPAVSVKPGRGASMKPCRGTFHVELSLRECVPDQQHATETPGQRNQRLPLEPRLASHIRGVVLPQQ